MLKAFKEKQQKCRRIPSFALELHNIWWKLGSSKSLAIRFGNKLSGVYKSPVTQRGMNTTCWWLLPMWSNWEFNHIYSWGPWSTKTYCPALAVPILTLELAQSARVHLMIFSNAIYKLWHFHYSVFVLALVFRFCCLERGCYTHQCSSFQCCLGYIRHCMCIVALSLRSLNCALLYTPVGIQSQWANHMFGSVCLLKT